MLMMMIEQLAKDRRTVLPWQRKFLPATRWQHGDKHRLRSYRQQRCHGCFTVPLTVLSISQETLVLTDHVFPKAEG